MVKCVSAVTLHLSSPESAAGCRITDRWDQVCAQRRNGAMRRRERLLGVLFLIHLQSLSASPDQVLAKMQKDATLRNMCVRAILSMFTSLTQLVLRHQFTFYL